ncbi:MAG: hypothetical protein WC635_15925 [Bacteriovorax sp.]|jgi:hypothetical protein
MQLPDDLKEEVTAEVYNFIDKYYKKLPRNKDGRIDGIGKDFLDNDVDALRHAYASGVFTQEYGETAAEFLGVLTELMPGLGRSTTNNPQSENMDLWNNAVGRKYGKKTTGRLKLFKFLLKAIKNNEMIISPFGDQRIYKGKKIDSDNLKSKVVVIKESRKGMNLLYLDVNKLTFLTKPEFLMAIKNGHYLGYQIRNIKGEETPVSKKDKLVPNNLG